MVPPLRTREVASTASRRGLTPHAPSIMLRMGPLPRIAAAEPYRLKCSLGVFGFGFGRLRFRNAFEEADVDRLKRVVRRCCAAGVAITARLGNPAKKERT